MLPLALELRDRDVLVIGLGRVGAHKARQLLEAGARVTVVTTEALAPVPEGLAGFELRPYRPGDLAGFLLVVSATADEATNDLIVAEARERAVLLNVVDDPSRCSFYFTSVYRDGDLMVSVSSSGASPSLAQWVRRRIETALPAGLGRVATRLCEERRALHAAGESTERDWNGRVEELVAEL